MRRAAAGAIDLVPIVAIAALVTYSRLRLGLPSRAVVLGPVAIVIGLLLLRDALRGLSPGKILVGLRAVERASGRPAGIPESVLRNLPLLPLVLAPLSPGFGSILALALVAIHLGLLGLSGRGLTDLAGGTVVVDRP